MSRSIVSSMDEISELLAPVGSPVVVQVWDGENAVSVPLPMPGGWTLTMVGQLMHDVGWRFSHHDGSADVWKWPGSTRYAIVR